MENKEEYRNSVLEIKKRSDDDFEKYITFISSGALGLTLTFIDNISPLKESTCIWIIVVGWISLALCLMINLVSHYISSLNNSRTVQDLDDDIDDDVLLLNIDKRNHVVNCLNIISIIALGLGICFILIFTSINAYYG